MNGAQWVVQALRAQGVDTVFGYPGGAIMPVYDALYDGGVEHLLCRHEQGAAMAAIGYARAASRRLHRHFRPRRHQPDHWPG